MRAIIPWSRAAIRPGGRGQSVRPVWRLARPAIGLAVVSGPAGNAHPGAAASLREGLTGTLTVLRLGVPPMLARSLRSTIVIESMISICREHAKNVKHWQDGQMALRWCAAGLLEADKQFRRVNGHMHLRALRAELQLVTAENRPA